MELLKDIARRVEQGDDEAMPNLIRQALDQGQAARAVLDCGLIAGMNRVSGLFRDQEIFLPEVLLAARALYAGLEVLKPLLLQEKAEPLGRVVIGTVQGDRHDIGKNLVGIMLRGAGFDVIDLGSDVTPERFVAAALQERAAVIGMSALLTTTMPAMRRTVELLRERGLTPQIRTIVGGAPVTAEYAREIGADAYGYDAANAVDQVKALLSRAGA